MAGKNVHTYNCKEVFISYGAHAVSGLADDSFVTVEPNGEGVTKVVGCDGEVARSMDPDNTSKVKIVLLQQSDSNAFFQKMKELDRATGAGMLPLLITDLRGGVLFSAAQAWITKDPSRVWGKSQQNYEWEFDTGESTVIDM